MSLARIAVSSALLAVVLSAGCAEKKEAAHPEEPAFSLALEVDVAPYSEAWVCWVGPLPTGSEPVAVRAIESFQTPGMHHMDLASIDFVAADIAPGMHDCKELYDSVPTLMEDMMTLYGAQEEHQTFDLPDGIAAVLPGGMDVLFEIHYVNASEVTVKASATIDAWSMPIDNVEERIWGAVVRDNDIVVDPMTRTTEWTRCLMNDDVDVFAISSHMHAHGVEASVRRFDGGTVTETPVYVNEDWERPLIATFMDEPVKVAESQGFEFRCVYENPTDAPVVWGYTAADEMCSMTLVFTPGYFTVDCTVVDSGRSVEPL